jgi:dUTP pyrophosphatase
MPEHEAPDLPIRIKRLEHGRHLPLPAYGTPGAAGMDLAAAVTETVVVEPGTTAKIPTGIAVAIPSGYEGQVRPRSGIAATAHVFVPNSPGTIDSDYRGEILVLLANLGREAFRVEPGMRIAQLVCTPVIRVEWAESDELPPTDRGSGGFGHTGR